MSRDQLIQFIADKGTQRKQEMFNITKFQTNDWQNTRQTAAGVDANIARMSGEKAEYEQWCADQDAQYHAEIAAKEQAMNDLRNKVRELEDAQAQKAESNTFKESCKSCVN